MSVEPLVEVSQGLLRGRYLESPISNAKYFEFKGIPYAKSPVGQLRFKAPEPAEPWEGVRESMLKVPACAQPDKATNGTVGDEDCLFLNVFTPKLPQRDSEPLPVMFFVHGGGFVYGTGTDTEKHGVDFLIEQDVVIVSFNYRLGVLGFLCLDMPEAQGNAGLKDQVLALKWVHENISKFGGDPDNVTAMGLSAGAASVELLQLSPTAKGLFQKAILHSGSALNPWARNSASNIKHLAFQIAKLRGKNFSSQNDLLNYLRELPLNDLIETSAKAIAGDRSLGGIHFGFVPTVEKRFPGVEAFLSEEPYALLKRGDYNNLPTISGVCRREGMLVYYDAPHIVEKVSKEKKLAEWLPFKLDDQQREELEGRMKLHYMDGSSGCELDDFLVDFFTDVDFLGGIWVATKAKTLAGARTHFFEFAYDGTLNFVKAMTGLDKKGACHNDEAGYLMPSPEYLPKEDTVPKEDKLLRCRMVRMWANFMKFGNPTPKTDQLLPTMWLPMSGEEACYLEIDSELTMREQLYPQRLKFFEHLYDKHWL